MIFAVIVWNLGLVEAPRPVRARIAPVSDLRSGAISSREQKYREDAVGRLERWLALLSDSSIEVLARGTPLTLSEFLEEYLYQLFEMRWSRGEGRQVLLGVADRFGWMRSQLAGPWRVLRNWERLEPDKRRSPCPISWLRALAVSAIAWHWESVALCLLLGFFGLLRPAEMCGLKRVDCLLRHEHRMGDFLLVRIAEPKSRWASGHQQYVRIDALAPLAWLEAQLAMLEMSAPLWPGRPSTFSSRLAALSKATLGNASLVLPSGLRTGGATFVFQSSGEDLPRLLWKGRWRDVRMLGIYIQELGAAMIRMRLEAPAEALVLELEDLYKPLFEAEVFEKEV